MNQWKSLVRVLFNYFGCVNVDIYKGVIFQLLITIFIQIQDDFEFKINPI